jgi:hypothetical protein
MKTAKEIVQRYDRLDKESERSNMQTIWQDVTDYVIPRKNQIIIQRTRGTQRNEKVFDSTAIHSNDLLAASLQGALTSNSSMWAKIVMADDFLNEEEEVKEWLDDATLKMYHAFNSSNHRLEIHEHFLDLTSIGTACTLIEEDTIERKGFNGLVFRTFPIMSYVFEETHRGFPDTVLRKICLTPRQAEQRFGKNAGKKVLKALKDNSNDEFEYIHYVVPVKEYGNLANSDWTFTDVYVSCADEEIVSEKGYHEFPYIISRWSKASGEKYGRSPSFNALPDVKMLNAAKAYMAQAWAMDIKPSRLVPQGEGITINNIPGQNIPVPVHLIKAIKEGALTSESRWEVSEMMVSDLRQAIKEVYYTDQIQLQKKAQMTATESTIMFELMQRLLGPIFGRMEIEIFSPMVERVFGIMSREGGFLEEPEVLEGMELDIQYVGPLARAQRMGEFNAMQKWIESLVPVASIRPEILDIPDWDKIVKDGGRLLSVNEKYIHNDEELEDIREARRQQAEEAQTTEEVGVAADAISKIGKLGVAQGGR